MLEEAREQLRVYFAAPCFTNVDSDEDDPVSTHTKYAAVWGRDQLAALGSGNDASVAQGQGGRQQYAAAGLAGAANAAAAAATAAAAAATAAGPTPIGQLPDAQPLTGDGRAGH